MATDKLAVQRPAEYFVQESQTRAAMTEAMASRSAQEVQAALVVAKRFPRDEFMSLEKIKTACKRMQLAEMAEYEYSRGGTKITGPTIDLLKAIAKRWGNIEYGWQEIERKQGESTVRAFAWDMETNARNELTFSIRHKRDTREGSYELKDERDIYELVANFAARRVRACLESVIDSDIVQTAVDECRRTLAGQNKEPLADQARSMVSAFSEFGITVAMIETRLGNKLDAISQNQLSGLRRVYKSLKDGVGQREDFFKSEGLVATAKQEPSETPENVVELEPEKAASPTPEGKTQKEKKPEPDKIVVGDTVQNQLAKVVTDGGFNYDEFAKWAKESGNVPGIEDFTSFSDIHTRVAERLLRSKAGMLKMLAEMKKGAA